MEEDLRVSRYSLETYNNFVKANAMELQNINEKEKESVLSAVEKSRKIITEVSASHATMIKEQQTVVCVCCDELNTKVGAQTNCTYDWHKKLNSQLHSTHDKIQKFVGEELRKDTPTGIFIIMINFNFYRKILT